MDQFSSNEIVKVKSVGEDGIPLKPIKRHKSKNSNSSSNSSQLFADGVHPSPGPEWVAEFAPWGRSAPPPVPPAPPSLAAPPARPPAPPPVAPPPYPAPLFALDPQVGQVGPAKVDTRRRVRQRTKRCFILSTIEGLNSPPPVA